MIKIFKKSKNVLDRTVFIWYYFKCGQNRNLALLAQLDRVTDYESVGRGFESLTAHQKSFVEKTKDFFLRETGYIIINNILNIIINIEKDCVFVYNSSE